MNSEYTIHELYENDFDILIPLMKNCFGMDVNLRYFEWKFKNNPAGFVEGYYAMHTNGEIAAYYGVIPELYNINGKTETIYQSCDTMTHSSHRRKGLFQKLAVHCYERLRDDGKLFIIGFGGGQSTPGFIKFGWKEIFKMRYLFYPRSFKALQSLGHSGVDEIQDYGIIENITLLSNSKASVHSVKSAKIYQWRVSNPTHNYKTIAVKGHNNAYDSYVTYYEDGDKIILFDFYVDNIKSGRQIFNYLKSKLSSRHKGIISLVQENSMWSKCLSKFGFVSNPFNKGPLNEKIPFIFYASEQQMNDLNNRNKWLINSFDHDAL